MRVLLINHFPLEGSGSGIYTINVAKSLINKNHEVCVIMPEIRKNYKRYNGIKLHPVYFYKEEKIDGQLPFNFPCFTTHPMSTNNFFSMSDEEIEMYKMAFSSAIEEEIRNFKPDIIHVQHIWILSSIAVNYNVPVVITAHGTDIIGYQRSNRFHSYCNNAVLKCKHIISISDDNNDLIINYFPTAKNKVTKIKNGYDEKIFYKKDYKKSDVLKSFGINETYDKIVCFAGKMTQIKGVDVLLKAAKMYENQNILTLLAGNGELFNEMNTLCHNLGLKNTYFLGNLDHDKLRELYNISDVSVVPSRFEAFGLVAIEALACGTPVIATKVGGLTQIINKDVGVLISTDDYVSLSKCIKNILCDNLDFDSNFIAKFAHDNYAQSSLIDKLIEVYKNSI